MALFVRRWKFTLFIVGWGLLNSYSRIYLGVHYPGDLLVGGLIGGLAAGILAGIVNGFATAVGFTISIVILAGIRERMAHNDIPESFKGMPIVLVTAGLMAIAFCGFSGLL